jgi:hypothetical protein
VAGSETERGDVSKTGSLSKEPQPALASGTASKNVIGHLVIGHQLENLSLPIMELRARRSTIASVSLTDAEALAGQGVTVVTNSFLIKSLLSVESFQARKGV